MSERNNQRGAPSLYLRDKPPGLFAKVGGAVLVILGLPFFLIGIALVLTGQSMVPGALMVFAGYVVIDGGWKLILFGTWCRLSFLVWDLDVWTCV